MPSAIRKVMRRTPEIEERPVGIDLINTQAAHAVQDINRTEKILQRHEAHILGTGKHPAQIIVPLVQIAVISIQRISLLPCHSRHIRVDAAEKIIVHLIQIIVLGLCQAQFERHAVGQETGIHPDVAQTGSHGWSRQAKRIKILLQQNLPKLR